jgi:hypothetical protein
MNRQQYLLVCFMEELAEIQQQVSKCLRFTTEHDYKGDGHSNLDELALEWTDLCAIITLLKEVGVDWSHCPTRLAEKIERTERLMQVSRERGVLK